MTDKKGSQRLLRSLLASLLREWDYDLVRQCLIEVHAEQAQRPTQASDRRTGKEHRRPTASEVVGRAEVDAAQLSTLQVFATRFDAKAFLPTAADVRHFLEMRGRDPGVVKHRQDAFRKVLDVLLSMPIDELEHLRASNAHSGPTKLGPLADAIMETSTAIRTGQLTVEPEQPLAASGVPEDGPEAKND